ncbi:hypothetical protein [Vibrio diazotrophicus]|uniref:hypothetical protein n=1 Tax=Vibrio diazotrophicus TaxID=685 RepID=UPI00142DD2C9|nr:hypothetical protein [Vibrio diazotrophicus]
MRKKELLKAPFLILVLDIKSGEVHVRATYRLAFPDFSANVFALLGLRSLSFDLKKMKHRFIDLKPALSFIGRFIGVKMLLVDSEWEVFIYISLLVPLVAMTVVVLCSVSKIKS